MTNKKQRIKPLLRKIGFYENPVPIRFWMSSESIYIENMEIWISYKKGNKTLMYKDILHEAFHHIIQNENGGKYDFFTEYRVDKRLRKFCKDEGLDEILDLENKRIIEYSKIDPKILCVEGRKYVYSAKRIIREEKL